ncbi:RagB/SusD family nutrient uptake outer membrane protein [Maribellus maritimus]|uniref:RagB/SusD family nutrient uptake outer membrane protein n=1 Tax=Maribellus maritimus TaxID=2870838 RepID=UPI001EE9CA74|nr:RagB/SusD family nutrient uptake outer membrane protein [Maribellus maritimus]MCG6191004.1 RagB/SusD family nutrient uptake outer membrane protein [Maribellus maritimus]
MKNKIFIIPVLFLLLYSCNNDYLELTPDTKLGESADFFESESGLETFTNSFYSYIDYAKITDDFNSDNCERFTTLPTIRSADYNVPTALGSGGWDWEQLRNINYFIANCSASGIDENIKNEYLAIAKFFRAWFYFDKVRDFGDVPWYSQPLQTNDEELLYKTRDSRTLVMDSVVNDLDFAIQYLPETRYKNKASKWTALALKSRICLYEGTWRKYHNDASLPDADKFINYSMDASKELMDADVYNLYTTGNPNEDYFNLFQATSVSTDEVIMAKSWVEGSGYYYTPLFTSTSNGNYGATHSIISSYLMDNGISFQEKYPSAEERDTMSYYNEFQNRDPRLNQTVVFPGYIRIGTTTVAVNDFAENRTGYQIIKRVGPPSEDQGADSRDNIIIRYAEILLNYAEAKAELGTLTQTDVDITLNVIRQRAGLPNLSLPVTNNAALNEEYSNTSDPVILEVRRERRVELAFEGFRKDDLIRWAEGHRFRAQYSGIYISGMKKLIDLDQDGNPDLYVLGVNDDVPDNKVSGVQYLKLSENNGLTNGTSGRIAPYLNRSLPEFGNWEYLNPIPREELTLNSNLEQNPGWDLLYK